MPKTNKTKTLDTFDAAWLEMTGQTPGQRDRMWAEGNKDLLARKVKESPMEYARAYRRAFGHGA